VNSQKIDELESVRGLAALLIVLFHTPKWNSILDIGIINNGYLMVELFFVLSGFVIFRSYGHQIRTAKDLFRFQLLRLGRLYPVHLLMLAVFIVFELAKYVALQKYGINSPNSDPFKQNSPTAIIQHLLLIQAIGPTGNASTFNGPAWSISVEFYTYFVFGLAVLALKKRALVFFAPAALIALTLLASHTTFGFQELLKCLTGFFIGCCVAAITMRTQFELPRCFSLIVLIGLVTFLQLKTPLQHDLIIYPLSAALVASVVMAKESHLNRFLRGKHLVYLGTISYAVYMSNAAIFWAANQFVRVVLKRNELIVGTKSTPQLTAVEAIAAAALVITAVLVVSICIYEFLEKPARDRSRRYAVEKLS
jgi:peptidoglycan/LPS O-acetylase OafA/YrhL